MSKKVWGKLVGLSVAAIVFVVLIWRNADKSAQFDFLLFTREIPQILLMIIVFALGFVTGIFTTFRISSKKHNK